MSKYTSGLIPSPPTVYSGTSLQGAFNDFLSAVHSGHFDTTRPALAAKGMLWTKDLGSNQCEILLYTGGTSGGASDNASLGIVDTSTGEFSGGVPIGAVIKWSGSVASIPYGYLLCDGTSGTPDLRGKFILGAGGAYSVGDTGGAATVTLDATEIPAHNHGAGTLAAGNAGSHSHSTKERNDGESGSGSTNILQAQDSTGAQNGAQGTQAAGDHTHPITGSTGDAGGGLAHENMPPYYALAYIKRVF